MSAKRHVFFLNLVPISHHRGDLTADTVPECKSVTHNSNAMYEESVYLLIHDPPGPQNMAAFAHNPFNREDNTNVPKLKSQPLPARVSQVKSPLIVSSRVPFRGETSH
jgi:hypothetical protein